MKSAVLVLAVCLALAAPASGAEAFTSEEQFSQWLTFYYRQPEPRRIPDSIRYYASSTLFEKQNARMPVAAFYAALFRKDPKLMDAAFQELSKQGTRDAKLVLLNAIWLAKLPKGNELLSRARRDWTVNPEIPSIIDQMEAAGNVDFLTGEVQGAAGLDMLWSAFMATGDSAPVRKIIGVLPMISSKDANEVLVGGAAKWSLTSNAVQHDRVYEICQQEVELQLGLAKTLLADILNDAAEKRKTQPPRGT